MPRQLHRIRAFNRGIASGIDREDVAEDAAVYAEDVDTLAAEGVLRGRMEDANATEEQTDEAAFLKRESDYDLIYRQAGDLKAVRNFYGTRSDQLFTLPSGAVLTDGLTFLQRGKALHIGCGATYPALWVGYTNWNHWGTADDGTLRCLIAECSPMAHENAGGWITESLTEHNAAGGFFLASKRYWYRFCLVYDGFQRSPLCTYEDESNVQKMIHPAADSDYIDVVFQLTGGVNAMNRRVTAVELYRAESQGGTENPPDEYYYRAAVLDTTAALPPTDSGAEPWYTYTEGSDQQFRYRDRGEVSYAYEAQSGIPEALESNTLRYGLSAEASDYLFAGACGQDDTPGAAMMIFRSKAHRFDMFNWAEEYLLLPFAPVAMASWNGKLYVFDSSTCVRVDPHSMMIEETLPGVGARGKRSVLPTEAGLFAFGAQNVYLIGAGGVVPVGDAVRSAQSSPLYTPVTIDSLGDAIAPVLGWDARGGLLVALVHRATTTYGLMVYDVKNMRWEYWTFSGVGRPCLIAGREGELYVGLADALLHVGGGASRKSALWISGVFTFGRAGTKKVYKVKLSGTGTASYAVDADAAWNALEGESLSSEDWLCTRAQFKLSVSPAEEVRSLDVVYRHLDGVR